MEDEEITSEVLLYAVGIDTVEDTDVGTVVLTELFSIELCVTGVVVGISVDLDFSVAGIIIVSSAVEVDSEDTVELSTITLDELFFEVYSDADDVIGTDELTLDVIKDVSVPNVLDTYDDVGIVIVGVIVRKVYPGDGVFGVCIVEETSEDVPELLIDVEVKLEDDSDTVPLRSTENEVSNTESAVSKLIVLELELVFSVTGILAVSSGGLDGIDVLLDDVLIVEDIEDSKVLRELTKFSVELSVTGVIVGISVDLDFSVAGIIIVSSAEEVDSVTTVLSLREPVIELEETDLVSFVFEEDTSELIDVESAIEDDILDDVVSETPIVGSELITDDVDSSIVEDEETTSDVLLYAVGIDTVEDTDVGTVVLIELFSIELCVTAVVVGITVDLDFSVAGIIIVSSAEEVDSETTVLSLRELAIKLDDTDLVSSVFEENTSEVTDVDVVIEVSETRNLDDVVSETPIVGSELITDVVDSSMVEDEGTTSDVLLYAVGIDAVEDTDVGTVVLIELFSIELCVTGVVVGITVDLDFSVAGIIIVSSAEEVDSETTVLSLRELVIELEETDLASFVFEEDTSEVTDVDVVIEVSETRNLDDVVSETPIVGSELITDVVDSSMVEDEGTTSDVLLYAVGIDAVEDTDVGTVVLIELFSIELCVTGVVVGITVDLDFSVAGIIIVSSAEEVDSETTVLSLRELVIELEETDLASFVFEEDTSEVTNVDVVTEVSETGNFDEVVSETPIVGSKLITDVVDSSVVEDEEATSDVLLYAVGIDTVEDTDVGTVLLTELFSIELCVIGVVVGIPDVLLDLSVAGITVSVSVPDELAKLDTDDFETVEYVRIEVLPVTSFTDVEDDKELSTDIEGVIVCMVSDDVNIGVEPYTDVKKVSVLYFVEEIVDVNELIEDVEIVDVGVIDDKDDEIVLSTENDVFKSETVV